MSILVIAEHDNAALNPSTLNTLSAATRLGGDVRLLVAGSGCSAVARSAAGIAGVAKVLLADAEHHQSQLAETLAELVVEVVRADADCTHVLAPSTSFGKNVLPRIAALLDVSQVSDVVAIETPDTFVRPFYAGNALARVQSSDRIKVLSIRTTAFDAALAGPSPHASRGARGGEVGAAGARGGLDRRVGRPRHGLRGELQRGA